MGYRILSLDKVVEIKRLLWEGKKQSSIAFQFNVSKPMVSLVCTGQQYPEAHWPDGTIGPMPEWKRLELHNQQKNNNKVGHIKEQMGTLNPRELAIALADALGEPDNDDLSGVLVSKKPDVKEKTKRPVK